MSTWDNIDISALLDKSSQRNVSIDWDGLGRTIVSSQGIFLKDYLKKIEKIGLEISSDSPDLEGWEIFKIVDNKDFSIRLISMDKIDVTDSTGLFNGIHYKETEGTMELFLAMSPKMYVIFGKNVPGLWKLDKSLIIKELDDTMSIPGTPGVSCEK